MNQPSSLPHSPTAENGPEAPLAPGRLLYQLRKGHKPEPVSLQDLANSARYSKGYLSKIETGEKPLTIDVARACDRALNTGGTLTQRVQHEQADRLADGTSPADVCPYPGLASFEPDDAAWFFGRERATAKLISRLAGALGEGGLTVVVAPSGSGKSSLLKAGLVPALKNGALPAPGSRHWPVKIFTPGQQPLQTLLDVLHRTTGVSPDLARKALHRGDHVLGSLLRARRRLLHQPVPPSDGDDAVHGTVRPVLIIDQFEELFTQCGQDTQREEFLSALHALVSPAHRHGAAVGPAALVVLGIRADYYGHCLTHPRLAAHLESGHLPLAPMSPADLRAAVTEPAARAGLTLEPGLVDVILRDLGAHRTATGPDCTAGALPLLAHALRATWQQRTDNTLTVRGYDLTGGIHQAIEATAERVYTTLDPAAREAAPHLLLRLVHLDHDGRATRRRLPLHPLSDHSPDPAAAQTVVETFTRARLLTLDTDHVAIAHEALLTAWPRLNQWITDDRDGLRTRQQLADAADHWGSTDRDPDLLYRGTQLAMAEEWAERHPWTAVAQMKDYLLASRDREDQEQRREKRSVRLLRLAVVALSALLVVTVAATSSVFFMREYARAKETQTRLLKARIAEQAARRQAAEQEAQLAEALSDPPVSVRCPSVVPGESSNAGWCAAMGGKLLSGKVPKDLFTHRSK
ncbi:helix-turn-helix domain-containing protein [Streptomyces sp. NPDC101175]|uniref:nSTAND1 domain-containing NTPase n=1 Tax=Streptomyces sp. NPDC101175 TaxID=3366123 RepID=UPI003833793C